MHEQVVCKHLSPYCHRIDYDEKEFGAVVNSFTLKPYEDERNVTPLAVYPLRFANNPAQIVTGPRQNDGGETLGEYSRPPRSVQWLDPIA